MIFSVIFVISRIFILNEFDFENVLFYFKSFLKTIVKNLLKAVDVRTKNHDQTIY